MTIHSGLPVAGYVAQSNDSVQRVNRHKEIEERVLRILDDLEGDVRVDRRMIALGRTQIQQAFMWINRAVFQPQRIPLPEDDDGA